MKAIARLSLSLALLICAWSTPAPAHALLCSILGCSCTVTASDLAFHNISPFAGDIDAESQIDVDCTGVAELFPSVVVQIQSGLYGSITARKMRSSAGNLLDYNIYTTTQRNIVWGNGVSGQTVTVSGGALAVGHWHVSRATYGRVAPTVSSRPGDYTDTVVVRVDW